MKTEFKLKGLGKPQRFDCEPMSNNNRFWCNVSLSAEKFNELWNYCKGNWSDGKIAEIEHDGFFQDGTPRNPIVIGIREAS